MIFFFWFFFYLNATHGPSENKKNISSQQHSYANPDFFILERIDSSGDRQLIFFRKSLFQTFESSRYSIIAHCCFNSLEKAVEQICHVLNLLAIESDTSIEGMELVRESPVFTRTGYEVLSSAENRGTGEGSIKTEKEIKYLSQDRLKFKQTHGFCITSRQEESSSSELGSINITSRQEQHQTKGRAEIEKSHNKKQEELAHQPSNCDFEEKEFQSALGSPQVLTQGTPIEKNKKQQKKIDKKEHPLDLDPDQSRLKLKSESEKTSPEKKGEGNLNPEAFFAAKEQLKGREKKKRTMVRVNKAIQTETMKIAKDFSQERSMLPPYEEKTTQTTWNGIKIMKLQNEIVKQKESSERLQTKLELAEKRETESLNENLEVKERLKLLEIEVGKENEKQKQIEENSKKKAIRETRSLSSKVTELKEENRSLTEKQSVLKNENRSLREKQSVLENENESLREKQSVHENENGSLREKLSVLENENNILTEKQSVLENGSNKITEKVSVLENESNKLTEKVSVLENENNKLRENQSVLENESSKLREEQSVLENENNKLREELGEYGNENNILTEKQSVLENENRSLREKQSVLENESNKLRENQSVLENESSKLREEQSVLENENNKLREELAEYGIESDELRKKQSVLESEKHELKEKLILKDQLHQSELMAIEKLNSKTESALELTSLKGECEKLRLQIFKAEQQTAQKIQFYEAKIIELNVLLSDSEDEVIELLERIVTINEMVNSKEEARLEKERISIESRAASISESEAQLEKLQASRESEMEAEERERFKKESESPKVWERLLKQQEKDLKTQEKQIDRTFKSWENIAKGQEKTSSESRTMPFKEETEQDKTKKKFSLKKKLPFFRP